MTAAESTVIPAVFAVVLAALLAYAAGRLHQWYAQTRDRHEAWQLGYESASKSLFHLATRVSRPGAAPENPGAASESPRVASEEPTAALEDPTAADETTAGVVAGSSAAADEVDWSDLLPVRTRPYVDAPDVVRGVATVAVAHQLEPPHRQRHFPNERLSL